MRTSTRSPSQRVGLVIVLVSVLVYACIYSFASVRRIQLLWASYFDLGIMHQTVYNTYQSIRTRDPSRFLELTDPHESGRQIKRIAIHSDALMALIAPLYFIHDGPETLLIVQTVVLASGALALYGICGSLMSDLVHRYPRRVKTLQIIIPLAYLMYPPLHWTNLYEFHAVTLGTAISLWMYQTLLGRRWVMMGILALLLLSSKEQAGLGMGILFALEGLRHINWKGHISRVRTWRLTVPRRSYLLFGLSVACVLYAVITVFVVIPHYRANSDHFALEYFEAGTHTMPGVIQHYIGRILRMDTLRYIIDIFGPLVLLPLASVYIIPALPDILINVISSSANMTSTHFQYTALITPWVFVAFVHTLKWISTRLNRMFFLSVCGVWILVLTYASWRYGVLPISPSFNDQIWSGSPEERPDVLYWSSVLSNDRLKVSSTGQLSPYFTSRRYFYDFGVNYDRAEYVLIRRSEIEGHWIKGKLIPFYDQLIRDSRYTLVYNTHGLEVYKRTSDMTPFD